MAGENISTNMSLPIPGTGVTSGPDWANDYNNCLSLVDAHTHGPGSGIQITPGGLNINADLTFASNSATALKKAAFTSQTSALTGTNFLSFVSGNLYANDGSGNQIPITSAGGVAGSPGSIGSLASPAAATYTAGSKLFTWTADSGKAAAMDNGAVTIRETNVASAKGITVQSASSLAADYSLTLPAALPASTQYFTSSSAGAVSFSTSNTIVAAVTRSTGTTVGQGGVAISASSSTFSTTSTSLTDVTNLSVTITVSGRPVYIGLISAGTDYVGGDFGFVAATHTGSSPADGWLSFFRDATQISTQLFEVSASSVATHVVAYPSSSFMHIDTPAGGTYTYKVQVAAGSSNSIQVAKSKLVVYEL